MPAAHFAFEAIGTQWQIDIYDYPPHQEGSLLLEKIKNRIAEFDKNYSRFRADSFVSCISKTTGTFTLPSDAQPLFDVYQKIYRLTDGAVTPLIGHLMEEAGYDANYSLATRELHRPPTWEEALDYHFPQLSIKKPVLLDVGAAGKGYSIDIIAGLLRAEDINSFCIDAGADIVYRNQKPEPLRIGLEHPENLNQAIGVANILNASICGSAGNRRTWRNFHHIIDPHTLASPRHILATWAIADTTLLADALATCLFFTPATKLLTEFNFQYVIMYADHSVEVSKEFEGEIFS
jgi:thiamine biosynthesis lipoprotein